MENFEKRHMANKFSFTDEKGRRVVNLNPANRTRGYGKKDLQQVVRTLESFTDSNKELVEEICHYLTTDITMILREFGHYLLEHYFGKGAMTTTDQQITSFTVRPVANGSESSDDADYLSIDVNVKLTQPAGGLTIDSFINPLKLSEHDSLKSLHVVMQCNLDFKPRRPYSPSVSHIHIHSAWQQAPQLEIADRSQAATHEASVQSSATPPSSIITNGQDS